MTILRRLEGGDRRSIGRANAVVRDVLADPSLFRAVFAGLRSGDAVVRARAADVIEKVTVRHPEYLGRYKRQLIGRVAEMEQIEVRWHVAQMLPRVRWAPAQRRRVLEILKVYLRDESSIVRTFAMQALADLAVQYPALRPEVMPRLQALTATGTPAMRARGKRLLTRLGGFSTLVSRRKRTP